MSLRHIQHRRGTVMGLALLLCALLLAACSTSTPPAPSNHTPSVVSTVASAPQPDYIPINHLVQTTGCGQASPILPGTSADVTIQAHPAESRGYHTRTYRVHVPIAYQANIAQAVVLAFHGYSGTAAGMENSSGFSPVADQQNFIAAYPQGLPNGNSGKPFWASVGPIDFGVDDALFVSDLLNDLQKKFCVDAQRIYATGFSNGGGMSGFLACRLAGRIAAFAPVSGNFYAIPGGCNPGRPVPILDFHGTADPLLPYNGVSVSEDPPWPLPPIAQWLQDWATRDGCTTSPTSFLQTPNVMGEQWTGCQGNAAVVHYRIQNGGHAWPPAINGRAPATVMWQFFQTHLLPSE